MISLRRRRRRGRHRARARRGCASASARSRPPRSSTWSTRCPRPPTGKILRRQVQGRPRRLNYARSALDRADRGLRVDGVGHVVEPLGVALERAVEEGDGDRARRARTRDRRAACTAARGSSSGVTIQRGAVRLSRSHSIECGYGSYSSLVSMMWRIGVPVSRTCGLLAFDRSPAIAITDRTRGSRQHSRNPTPNEMTSPSECPAAAMRSGSTSPPSGSSLPERRAPG